MDLAQENLPLVRDMVRLLARKRAYVTRSQREEWIAEGNLALVRAAIKFDPSRGFKFSTYACRAIINAIYRLWRTEGKWESTRSLPAHDRGMILVRRPARPQKSYVYPEYMAAWRLKNRERINAYKRAWRKARAA